jgi:histone acetyltransferase (RNA polymerase elongator complex component)
LNKYSVTTIELGVQSLDDAVLRAANRGHTAKDVYSAVKLIKEYGFSLGLQMMTGLPGDTDEKSIETAKKIIELKPDFARIYPTLVLKDTKLEEMYKNGQYSPQELDDAVSLCKELLILFTNAGIPVIRISLQTTDEISPNGSLVAGPFNSQFRELVESEIYFDKFATALEEISSKDIIISVNPKDISKAIGSNKANINKIKNLYDINLKIVGDDKIKSDSFYIVSN